MYRNIVIAGIGTDTGKTVISAIITEALEANYWKPIQCGEPRDSETISSLISKPEKVLEEGYMLKEPMSPHGAADLEGVKIEISKLGIPKVDGNLVIELAGGLMVPLNDSEVNLNLVQSWGADVELLLVADYYLGSINHTLSAIEILKQSGINILGIIFNGEEVLTTREAIERRSPFKTIGLVEKMKTVDKETILSKAEDFWAKNSWIK